jgi:PAS domain-containing protein
MTLQQYTSSEGQPYTSSGAGNASVAPAALLNAIVNGTNPAQNIRQLIHQLRQDGYSVIDLLRDTAILKNSLADTITSDTINRWVLLDRVVQDCLAETSLPLELFLDHTLHAFCEFDHSGTILFANKKMLSLTPGCLGQCIYALFDQIDVAIQSSFRSNDLRHLCQLTVKGSPHDSVLAEFQQIETPTGIRQFALFVDMADFAQAENKALDAVPYGMLKLSSKYRVLYANARALELLELPLRDLIGKDPRQFVTDPASQAEIVRQSTGRNAWRGGQFEITLTRPISKTPIDVRIATVPTFDLNGAFSGVFIAVHPTHYERARQEITRCLSEYENYHQLFKQLMDVVARFVPFVAADLTLYTDDLNYSCVICQYPETQVYRTRWFPITAPSRAWINQSITWMDDLATWLADKSDDGVDLTQNVDVQATLRRGVKGIMMVPVRRGTRTIGGLWLQSTEAGAYNLDTMKILRDRLSIDQALQAVFSARQLVEANFVSTLQTKIATSANQRELANTVCSEIARFYDFQNVSMFKVSVLSRRFEILDQSSGPTGGFRIPDNYVQDLDRGMLGLAYKREVPIFINDASAEAINCAATEESQHFKRVASETLSELCIPIKHNGRVLWILNLEDSHTSAFPQPEVARIGHIAAQIALTLEHIFKGLVLDQIMDVFPDAIIVVSVYGKILRANRNALKLLEVDLNKDLNEFSSYLDDTDDVKVLWARCSEPRTATIMSARGTNTRVLLQSFTLPDQYDHVVVRLQDIADLQWVTDLERLKAALAESSSLVRVPLSLVSSFLQQIPQHTEQQTVQDLARRALRQLGRIELTYDRVLASYDLHQLPDENLVPVNVLRALDHIRAELPAADQRAIKTVGSKGTMMVLVDAYRLTFILESMLAYLLRVRAGAGSIVVEVRTLDTMVEVSMAGPARKAGPGTNFGEAVEVARTDIALAATVLQQFAERFGGSFKHDEQVNRREKLILTLPLAARMLV